MDSTRRFPGRVLSSSTSAELPRRDRLLLAGCIALITLLAWAYLVHLGRQMSAEMEHGKMMAEMGMAMDMPWSKTDVFFTFIMWAVMMIGMMAPSASPTLMLFAAAQAGRGVSSVSAPTLAFGLGYVAVWTGFSAVAALVQWGLHDAAMLSAAMAFERPADRGDLDSDGRVSTDAFERQMLDALPDSPGVPIDELAGRSKGGLPYGLSPRVILPCLLLGADVCTVRGGSHEPDVGSNADRLCVVREDRTGWRNRRTHRGSSHGCPRDCSDCLTCRFSGPKLAQWS